MSYFGSHFVFAYILNCSTLRKFQFSVWSSAMPKETESTKKKLNTSKRGIAQWLPDYTHTAVFPKPLQRQSIPLICQLFNEKTVAAMISLKGKL